MLPNSIIKPSLNSPYLPLFLLLNILIFCTIQIEYHSNFNVSKISNITSSNQPLLLPLIYTETIPSNNYYHPYQYQNNKLFYMHNTNTNTNNNMNSNNNGNGNGNANNGNSNIQSKQKKYYKFKRYQLLDTTYNAQQQTLSDIQQSILFNMQPPMSVFNIPRTITISDYQLLSIKNINIILINPTDRFKFCINQIYTDFNTIKRIEQRKLPFCLLPNNKYPFYFNLFISQDKPMLYRTTIYFIINVYDGEQLVDQKIWPREIIANVNTNHLRISTVQSKYCVNSNNNIINSNSNSNINNNNGNNNNNNNYKTYTSIIFTNPMSQHIKISIQNEIQLLQKMSPKNIMIPSQKNINVSIIPKQQLLQIITKPYQLSYSDIKYPNLYLPIQCIKYLQIHNINYQTGTLILNNDRSIFQFIVPITSYAQQIIQIKYIEIYSNNQNVQFKNIYENYQYQKIQPREHLGICKLILHVNTVPIQKTQIQIKIGYILISNKKQIYQAKNIYKFYQFRNPISVGSRRFIDVTKIQNNINNNNNVNNNNNNNNDQLMQNIFPIRNNLNLPLLLLRVIYDQKIFKLTWLNDRREYIYPNHQRQQFSFQYIGPKQLKLSPTKYIIILQFNNNILIPIQIVIYDHTLQCVYNNIVQKCQSLPIIDYGYFRTNTTKFKQLIIRNWNPIQKQIKLKLLQNIILNYGINCTLNIFGPFPNYQLVSRYNNGSLYFYIKGNHYIILNIAMIPLKNATSGQLLFEFSTQNQQINKKIKFKVQNGTIALIPQILRISSAYQHTVQYLNLVSTFSQPYKIKNTYVNNSNINIFFNNHSQIYENQWIGLALVYQPFHYNYNNNINPTTSSLLSTSISTISSLNSYLLNITQICCGNQFMSNYFINPLYHNQYQKFTYVSVKVITTTELETNSTIIIDNTAPKLIKNQNFSIAFINYKDFYYSITNNDNKQKQKFNLNRIKDTNNNDNNNNNNNNKNNNNNNDNNNNVQQISQFSKYNKDYKITIKNIFKQYIKYKPIIIPKSLYQDTKQYISSIKRSRKNYQDTMLCVNNIIAIKHNFSPQMVKTILALDTIPQQITIQPLGNQQYYIGSQKKNVYDPNSTPELSKYVRKTVANGARVCYKMNTTKYIKQLIQSYILNDIAQNFSNQIFHLFVQKQMEYYNTPQHYLIYDEFYDSLKLQYNFEHYCKKSVYPFFRFCKQINIIVLPSQKQSILQPNGQGQITIKAISKFKQISQSFYIAILNNITKYQVHLVEINITQPKLKINKLYVPIQNKNQDINNNVSKNNVMEISKVQNYIKTQISKKQLSKLIKIKENQIIQNDSYVKKYISNCLLVLLKQNEIVNQQFVGERNFTIKNIGTIDIQITHIGFDKNQKLCKFEGIQINQQLCNGFVLSRGQQKNITLKINFPINNIQQLKQINMYLYNEEAFYFKFNVLLKSTKNISQYSWQKSIYSLIMTALSFIFLVLVILMFKKQIDEKQNAKQMNIKTKIMNTSNYVMLGTRIQKKLRKLQPIPQQQILAVKDIQQSKIKQFFNSSGESQIAKRQHTQQQQQSKIEILNALKNDRNSMSASQQSSIDFIDLNALNKSTQNIEHENQQSQQNQNQENIKQSQSQSQQQGDKGSLGSGKDGSDADSNFNDGDQIDYSNVNTNTNYGWGDQNQERKKQQQSSNSYYNVFFSQNPLKKNQKSGPFHWMNEQRKR